MSSTYHGWLAREAAPDPREAEDRGLLSEIVDIHNRSGCTFGSPRCKRRCDGGASGLAVSGSKRLMREHDLQGAFLRKGWRGGSTKQNRRPTRRRTS
jgi:hypothetical protein